jgi:hypothetical protein
MQTAQGLKTAGAWALMQGVCDEKVTARLGPGFKFTARSHYLSTELVRGVNLAFAYRVKNMVDFEHEQRAHTRPY